jgi:hypothetical protein
MVGLEGRRVVDSRFLKSKQIHSLQTLTGRVPIEFHGEFHGGSRTLQSDDRIGWSNWPIESDGRAGCRAEHDVFSG